MGEWYCWDCDSYFREEELQHGEFGLECPNCGSDDIEEVDSSWVE